MRYVLITFLISAVGVSAAVALPSAHRTILGVSTPDAVVLVAKKKPMMKRTTKRETKRSQKDLGGIHPLVGSGDY